MVARVTKLALSLVAGFGLLASAGAANAATQAFSGILCMGINATEQAKISYSPYGVQNNASTTATVVCPVATPFNATVTKLHVRGYDRHVSQQVVCQAHVMDQLGNSFVSGSGADPVGSQQGPTGFDIIPVPSGAYGLTMQCTIPPVNVGTSHLTSYQITTNP